jgi:4-carboxymuconolactone decarboxylase
MEGGTLDEQKRHEEGTKARRAVLGDAHVDRSEACKTEFTKEFQELITRHAWGEIWTRPGLDKKTRSLITIAMLVALNRPDELRLHLRGALRNGAKKEEIKEVLLQAAVYCGVPAANSAFHVAGEVMEKG